MNIQKYPLIFDARVAKTIGQLTSNNKDLSSILDFSPRQDANSYNTYVNKIHEIATQLETDAEKIEYFLFNSKIK